MSERKAVQRFSRKPQVLSGEDLLSGIGSPSMSTAPRPSESDNAFDNESNTDTTFSENKIEDLPQKSQNRIEKTLRSGHELVVDLDGDELFIMNKHGDTELTIHIKDDGPVVECKGTRLKLSAPQSIDLLCEDFKVQAEGDIHLNANRQLTIESTEELHLNCEVDIRLRGRVIWLN
ncbi:MAG: hypothetical protein CMK59_12395 [Proteobacteria bacterium]|nr:hypothetical protein [Pseudomonadota bacterium]